MEITKKVWKIFQVICLCFFLSGYESRPLFAIEVTQLKTGVFPPCSYFLGRLNFYGKLEIPADRDYRIDTALLPSPYFRIFTVREANQSVPPINLEQIPWQNINLEEALSDLHTRFEIIHRSTNHAVVLEKINYGYLPYLPNLYRFLAFQYVVLSHLYASDTSMPDILKGPMNVKPPGSIFYKVERFTKGVELASAMLEPLIQKLQVMTSDNFVQSFLRRVLYELEVQYLNNRIHFSFVQLGRALLRSAVVFNDAEVTEFITSAVREAGCHPESEIQRSPVQFWGGRPAYLLQNSILLDAREFLSSVFYDIVSGGTDFYNQARGSRRLIVSSAKFLDGKILGNGRGEPFRLIETAFNAKSWNGYAGIETGMLHLLAEGSEYAELEQPWQKEARLSGHGGEEVIPNTLTSTWSLLDLNGAENIELPFARVSATWTDAASMPILRITFLKSFRIDKSLRRELSSFYRNFAAAGLIDVEISGE
jgi:hypothetical protein